MDQHTKRLREARNSWRYVDEYLSAIDTLDEDLLDHMYNLRAYFDARPPRPAQVRGEGGKFVSKGGL
jgi:hypothetical protein